MRYGFDSGFGECLWGSLGVFGGFPKLGVPFRGPYNKDYTIFGVYIGVPLYRETTICDSIYLVQLGGP